jgi:hypothetical protein
VWGREDLTCPLPWKLIRQKIRWATAHPWRGDQPLGPGHCIDTTGITEPGRLTRVLFGLDYGYHGSGWWANSEFERCWHLSISHPRPELVVSRRVPADMGTGTYQGMDLETPTDNEARAWGRVFFRQHVHKALFEPAVGPLDPYRTSGVVHLRVFLDQAGRPIVPRGEVYDLLPFADGSSPAKIVEGRLGGDVR